MFGGLQFMLTYFLAIFTVTMLLVIWFDTEAFEEYVRLFRVPHLFCIDEYDFICNIIRKDTPEMKLPSYIEFLLQYHNNFFTRMISCHTCLSVWLSLFVCVPMTGFFLGILSTLPVALSALFLYRLFGKVA